MNKTTETAVPLSNGQQGDVEAVRGSLASILFAIQNGGVVIEGWNNHVDKVEALIAATASHRALIGELATILEMSRAYMTEHDEGCDLDPDYGLKATGNIEYDEGDEPIEPQCTCPLEADQEMVLIALTKAKSALEGKS